MRGMKTARALGEIDEKFIEEAAPGKRITVKVFPWKATAIAACLALVICIGSMAVLFGKFNFETAADSDQSSESSSQTDSSSSNTDQSSKWEKKIVKPDDSSKTDLTIETNWELMKKCERFPEISQSFNYGKRITFHSTNAVIAKENLGDMLYNITLDGYDSSNDTMHHALADIYEIKGVSRDVAVAVYLIDGEAVDSKYDWYYGSYKKIREQISVTPDSDSYFVYINPEFRTDTLYSFAQNTGLNNSYGVKYSCAYYYPKDQNSTIMFENIDRQTVWDLLFSNGSKDMEISDADTFLTKEEHRVLMSLSVNSDILGVSNKSITITEDGYIFTNILMTARVYNIGKAKAEKFVNYVLGTCKGYELVTDTSDSSAYSAKPELSDQSRDIRIHGGDSSTVKVYVPNKDNSSKAG